MGRESFYRLLSEYKFCPTVYGAAFYVFKATPSGVVEGLEVKSLPTGIYTVEIFLRMPSP